MNSDNIFSSIFRKTILEFIQEIRDILASKRYDVPDVIKTDLQMAEIVISAASQEFITEIMSTFGKFVIQYEKQIKEKDVEFFNRLDVCTSCCIPAGSKKVSGHCKCLKTCVKTCSCDAKCSNCSDLLKELDSKTLVAARFIIEQAVKDTDKEKKEDIEVIFTYISSLLAASKNYKKR